MSEPYDVGEPVTLAVGAIGEPGQRVFLLQAQGLQRTVTVKLEKAQVAALVEYLGELLGTLSRPGELDELPALQPAYEPDFVVGRLAVTYDEAIDRVLIIAGELTDSDREGGETELEEADDTDRAVLRVEVTREQAASFAIAGRRLVEAGRPPCPLCGYPLDPRGHSCPKTNGHRAPLT